MSEGRKAMRHPRIPAAGLVVGPEELPAARAGRDFFLRDTRVVARELLGAWLVRQRGGASYAARVVEVEAYLGVEDRAAHSWGGRRTARVEPMYGPGGLLYVFQIYGMYFCANVVTRERGVPQAVLLRAAAHPRLASGVLSGPGRLCRAFGITKGLSGLDLVDSAEFEVRPAPVSRRRIALSTRIGVDYAGPAKDWPLRYCLAGASAVTSPRPAAVRRTRTRRGR
jgi:DNA-3-methyladenine glycosylase